MVDEILNESSLVAASFYCKPASRKKTLLLDHISETYHFLSSKCTKGLFWIFMADKNDLKLDSIMSLNQNFKQLVDQPIRENPPQILDIIITDLWKYYQIPTVEPPLEVDDDKIGSASDHKMVVMSPLSQFQNKRGRSKRSIESWPLMMATEPWGQPLIMLTGVLLRNLSRPVIRWDLFKCSYLKYLINVSLTKEELFSPKIIHSLQKNWRK